MRMRIQAIRSFEESRLVQYDEASFGEFLVWTDDAAGPLKDNLPLKNPLRPKYSQMMGGEQKYDHHLSLDDDVPFYHLILDEVYDPPSYWPPRLLHKSYYLERVGLNILEEAEADASTSYEMVHMVNDVSDALGLSDLVEADLQQLQIDSGRQQQICHTIVTNYDRLASLSYMYPGPGLDGMVGFGLCFLLFYSFCRPFFHCILQESKKINRNYYPLTEHNPFF